LFNWLFPELTPVYAGTPTGLANLWQLLVCDFTGWMPFLSPNQQCQCTVKGDTFQSRINCLWLPISVP